MYLSRASCTASLQHRMGLVEGLHASTGLEKSSEELTLLSMPLSTHSAAQLLSARRHLAGSRLGGALTQGDPIMHHALLINNIVASCAQLAGWPGASSLLSMPRRTHRSSKGFLRKPYEKP